MEGALPVKSSNKPKLIFFCVVVLLILGFFFSMKRILIPFGIAYIMALLLMPLKRALYSVSLRKKTFSIIAAMLVGYAVFYPIVHGIKTITEESYKIEIYLPKLENFLREKYALLKTEVYQRFNYEITVNPVDEFVGFAKDNTQAMIVYLPKMLGSLLEWSFIIPLFLFFILKDGRTFRFQFLRIVPNNLVEKTYFLFHQFNTKFGDYIFAKSMEAAIVGIIITVGLWIIGFPFAFLLGMVAAVTNILPYIGPILGYVPALVIGLVDENPNTTLGAMTILYAIANLVDLALVFPLLVSKIVNLHPMVVVISVIFGSQFGGVVGMIVSIPLAAFLKLLITEIYREVYPETH